MSVLRLTTCALVLAFASNPTFAQDEFDAEAILEKAERAYLHLDVTGFPAGSTNQITQSGKAFAIGPDLLLTASHVLGDWSDWEPETEGQPEVIRALRPVKREIGLTSAKEGDPLDVATIVMPTFAPMIDATTIRVPKLGLLASDLFQLSLCDIQDGETYHALLSLSDTPELPDSVRDTGLVELVAESYQPERFGGLYVFRLSGGDTVAVNLWGHDGAPIFAADGSVAALVSAVIVEGDKTLVLATPVQSLIPGTSALLTSDPSLQLNASARPKCSIVDLVDRMASNLEWKITRERVKGRLTRQLIFSYNSVSVEPAFDAIEVRTAYWGTDQKGKYNRLQVKSLAAENGELVTIVESTYDPNAEIKTSQIDFFTDEVIATGEALMNEPGDKKQRVMSVEFTISPVIGSEVSQDFKLIEIQWNDLVGPEHAG